MDEMSDIDTPGSEAGSVSEEEEEENLADLEIALYSQIHFAENVYHENTESTENDHNKSVTDLFTIDVKGEVQQENSEGQVCSPDDGEESDDTEVKDTDLVCQSKDDTTQPLSTSKGTVESKELVKPLEELTFKERKRLLVERLRCVAAEEDIELQENMKPDEISVINSTDDVILLDSDEEGVILMLDDNLSDVDNEVLFNVNRGQHHLLTKQELQSVQDIEGWEISEKDKPSYKAALTRGRYYSALGIRCRNCDQLGHTEKTCRKPKKQVTCIFCSERGHSHRKCSQAICFNCGAPGHSAATCPQPRRLKYENCHRCGMSGHNRNVCPDIWRQYHMTTTVGQLVKLKKRMSNPSCYNCGGDDHFGFECYSGRIDSYSRAAYPFICSYSAVKQWSTPKSGKESHSKKRKLDDEKKYLNEKKAHKKGRDKNTEKTDRRLQSKVDKFQPARRSQKVSKFIPGRNKGHFTSSSLDDYTFDRNIANSSKRFSGASHSPMERKHFSSKKPVKSDIKKHKFNTLHSDHQNDLKVEVSLRIGHDTEEDFPRGGRHRFSKEEPSHNWNQLRKDIGGNWGNKSSERNKDHLSGSKHTSHEREVVQSSRGFKISIKNLETNR